MANYTGLAAVIYESTERYGILPYGEATRIQTSPVRMDSTIKQGGSYSRMLLTGEKQSVWVGCDAGTQTISVWAYPNPNGVSALEIFDPDTEVSMGRDISVSSGAWEQLAVEFTAEKKVYIATLINFAKASGDTRAYFDNLDME